MVILTIYHIILFSLYPTDPPVDLIFLGWFVCILALLITPYLERKEEIYTEIKNRHILEL